MDIDMEEKLIFSKENQSYNFSFIVIRLKSFFVTISDSGIATFLYVYFFLSRCEVSNIE